MAKYPRLDKYERLVSRLYEAIALLLVWRPDPRTPIKPIHDGSTLEACQRRLTTNLAFICDWDKGGDTTTSIGIQTTEQCFRYWLATNKPKPRPDCLDFLKRILTILKDVSTSQDFNDEARQSTEDSLLKHCVEFASKRIRKEWRILKNGIDKCQLDLEANYLLHGLTLTEMESLAAWLRKLCARGSKSLRNACLVAYDIRGHRHMGTLDTLRQKREDAPELDKAAERFGTVHHFVGRIAEHVRVPKQLIEDSTRLQGLLDLFEVANIPDLGCTSPPLVDELTTLDGILTRMSSVKNPDKGKVEQKLRITQQAVDIEGMVKAMIYDFQDKAPRVHSELKVLEHFYRNRLDFAPDIPWVGTSKLSCLECKLYFRYHPSNPLEPGCHEQVSRHWGLIKLPKGSNDERYVEQRDILNPLIHDLGQIIFRNIPNGKHPNSTTGITKSIICRGTDYSDDEPIQVAAGTVPIEGNGNKEDWCLGEEELDESSDEQDGGAKL